MAAADVAGGSPLCTSNFHRSIAAMIGGRATEVRPAWTGVEDEALAVFGEERRSSDELLLSGPASLVSVLQQLGHGPQDTGGGLGADGLESHNAGKQPLGKKPGTPQRGRQLMMGATPAVLRRRRQKVQRGGGTLPTAGGRAAGAPVPLPSAAGAAVGAVTAADSRTTGGSSLGTSNFHRSIAAMIGGRATEVRPAWTGVEDEALAVFGEERRSSDELLLSGPASLVSVLQQLGHGPQDTGGGLGADGLESHNAGKQPLGKKPGTPQRGRQLMMGATPAVLRRRRQKVQGGGGTLPTAGGRAAGAPVPLPSAAGAAVGAVTAADSRTTGRRGG
eukprot:g14157.t1